ncbi:deoxyribonuclease-2-alpha [Protopterus annectens]|uniref:deoxyribonuclease-2-alpha n=1 Tax=Protopterus annectens TaxID=7888 RepID=UPI001CFBF562|nr:deoxyribonuclease-2-alpha [Protopterus annectens]
MSRSSTCVYFLQHSSFQILCGNRDVVLVWIYVFVVIKRKEVCVCAYWRLGRSCMRSAEYCISVAPVQLTMLFLVILTTFLCSTYADISCYNDDGQPVDWFIIYKLPKLKENPDHDGETYMYQDASTQAWVESTHTMNDTDGAVGHTLQQFYKSGGPKNEGVAYVLYNDQFEEKMSYPSKFGHTKGVILLDQEQGIWLVHSTPKFPPKLQEGYYWPHNGLRNGQSFLCVTYSYSSFKAIGNQLMYTEPDCYESSLPPSFADDFPELVSASQGKFVKKPPWTSQVTLTSVGGKAFTSFAKNGHFEDDLYSGWLSGALESNLLVQFWPNSAGVLPSNCSIEYFVYSIEYLQFSQAISFSHHIDHSKWCISKSANDSGKPWTCIGDMNRVEGEMKRGGGTVCTSDAAIWKAFYKLIEKYEDCS